MTLSVKGRRVRVHSLGKGIRFPQRAWPSEAAILAHSLKQAKRIHRTYGEAWKNPQPTRTVVLKSKSTADYTISRVTDHRGEKLFHVRFIGGPRAGHTGNDYLLGDLLDWVGKMGYRVRGAQSNPLRHMSKRQGVRRERKKWRSLSKAERKRIHREETVEVRDIWRNPRRRNPAGGYPNSLQGQRDMCSRGGHIAACNMLQEQVDRMEKHRSALMRAWREGGKTDALWSDVEAYDKLLDEQAAILSEMRSR